MRALSFGLAVAAGLVLLLLATLWGSAWSAGPEAPSPAELYQGGVVSFRLTATVGTDPTRCASTRTAQVRANTPVYYCLSIQNTGDITLTTHALRITRPRRDVPSFDAIIPPRAVTHTVALGIVISEVVGAQDVTNTLTWSARASNGTETSQTAQAAVDVVAPSLSVVKTVGTDRTTCPTTANLSVPSNQSVYFCITVQNTGDVTFTRHALVDAPLGLNLPISFAYTLPPQARLVITAGTFLTLGIGGALGPRSIVSPLTNTVRLTSTTAGGLAESRSAAAAVSVGNVTVVFSKTVGTDPLACPTTTNLSVPPGSQLYYCASIRNTGAVTLTHHQLVELQLSIDLSFTYTLTPGSLLTVTNATLVNRVQPPQPRLFGPFEFSNLYPAVVNNTMFYTGTTADGFRVSSSASTSASFPDTPTPTRTREPDPTDTSTPFPTSTPTDTPIPVPPTPTPTPTFTPVTPTPTPTRSYAISSLATPTPFQPLATPPPFVDPALFALTLTAEAATAAAGPFGSPLEPPTPDLNAVFPTFEPTPPLSPLEVPTVPLELPTLALPAETPTALPTLAETMTPTSATPTAPLPPSPTPTPVVVLLVVTDTPLPAGQRPIVYPTPTPTSDLLLITATMIDAAAVAAGWLWFLGGLVVFFAAAGIVAGLFFHRQEARRFDLVDGGEELEVSELPADPHAYAPDADDPWPDNLP